MENKPVILAVDDTPENLDVVRGVLADDYQVRVAPNGHVALKIARAQLPDLILLDVMMPEIDGYEVCRQLKADPETAAIPVMFVTAKAEVSDEAAGFALGAADYISKPINPVLLRARIQTQLQLKHNLDRMAELSERLARANQKMEEELSVGQQIQLSMLPTEAPSDDAFVVNATMRAARQVGGDLYDYFYVSPSQFCICVADISDKGVPASLFMAVTKTLIRANARDDASTASIVTRINDELARDNAKSMFATLFIALIDVQTGELCYSNAGHNKPYIRRADGTVEVVPDLHGPVAGAMEELPYGESRLRLAAGDLVFLYTDGVSEAINANDELFGETRIEQFLVESTSDVPEQIVGGMLDAVDHFANGCEQSDDITLLCFRYQAAGNQDTQAIEYTLTNQLSEIDRLNEGFNGFADAAGMPMALQMKTNLVFDELISNIVNYAYADDDPHQIRVRIEVSGSRMLITISDDGGPFNPLARQDPNVQASLDEREIGGLGIFLVKELMDEVHYSRHQNSNRMTLSKRWDPS